MTAHNPLANSNLPETSAELLPVAQNQGHVLPSTPEKQAMSSELPGSGQAAPQVTSQPPVLPTSSTPAQPQAVQTQHGSVPLANTPHAADDVDLIEKEWVQRAKALVAKTKDDPHQQNKEINKFKADYIKKRYNKEIKVSEG